MCVLHQDALSLNAFYLGLMIRGMTPLAVGFTSVLSYCDSTWH